MTIEAKRYQWRVAQTNVAHGGRLRGATLAIAYR